MSTFFFRQLRSRPDVVPLVAITGVGAVFAAVCIVRTCVKKNEITWKHRTNPHPNEHIEYNENTKFFQAFDYKDLKDERPRI